VLSLTSGYQRIVRTKLSARATQLLRLSVNTFSSDVDAKDGLMDS